MAKYKGRDASVLGLEERVPMVVIVQDLTKETVKLSEVEFTSEEKERLLKDRTDLEFHMIDKKNVKK